MFLFHYERVYDSDFCGIISFSEFQISPLKMGIVNGSQAGFVRVHVLMSQQTAGWPLRCVFFSVCGGL